MHHSQHYFRIFIILFIFTLIQSSISTISIHNVPTFQQPNDNNNDDNDGVLTLVPIPTAILSENGIRFKFAFECTKSIHCLDDFTIQYQIKSSNDATLTEPLFLPISVTTRLFFPQTITTTGHQIGEQAAPPFSNAFAPDVEIQYQYQTEPTRIPFFFNSSLEYVNVHGSVLINLSDIQDDIFYSQPPIISVLIMSKSTSLIILSQSFDLQLYQEALSTRIASPLIVQYLPTNLHPIPKLQLQQQEDDDEHYEQQEEQQHDVNHDNEQLQPSGDKLSTYISFYIPYPSFSGFNTITIHFNGANQYHNTTKEDNNAICFINYDNPLLVKIKDDGVDKYLIVSRSTTTSTLIPFDYDQESTIQITCTNIPIEPIFSTPSSSIPDLPTVGCHIAISFDSHDIGGFSYTHHYNEALIKPAILMDLLQYYPLERNSIYQYSSELDTIHRLGNNNNNDNNLSNIMYSAKLYRTTITTTTTQTLQITDGLNITRQLFFQYELQWPALDIFEQDDITIHVVYFITGIHRDTNNHDLLYYGPLSPLQTPTSSSSTSSTLSASKLRWRSELMMVPVEQQIIHPTRSIQIIVTISHPFLDLSKHLTHPTSVLFLYYRIGNLPTTLLHNSSYYQSQLQSQQEQQDEQEQEQNNDMIMINNNQDSHVYLNDTIVQSGSHSFTYNPFIDNTDIELNQFHIQQEQPNSNTITNNNDIPSSNSNEYTTQSAIRDFTLQLQFTTQKTTPKTKSFILSFLFEPAYNFYGKFKNECTLNDIDVISSPILPYNNTSSKLYIEFNDDTILLPSTLYTLQCGGVNSSIRFDPSFGRLDQTITLSLTATTLDENYTTATTTTTSVPKTLPNDELLPNIYSRSIPIIPSQIITDEIKRKQFLLVVAIISSIVSGSLLLLLTLYGLYRCYIRYRKRKEEYNRMMEAITVDQNQIVDFSYYDYHYGLTPGGDDDLAYSPTFFDDTPSLNNNNKKNNNDVILNNNNTSINSVPNSPKIGSPITFDTFGQNRVVFSPNIQSESSALTTLHPSTNVVNNSKNNNVSDNFSLQDDPFTISGQFNQQPQQQQEYLLKNQLHSNPEQNDIDTNDNTNIPQSPIQNMNYQPPVVPNRHISQSTDEGLHFSLGSDSTTERSLPVANSLQQTTMAITRHGNSVHNLNPNNQNSQE